MHAIHDDAIAGHTARLQAEAAAGRRGRGRDDGRLSWWALLLAGMLALALALAGPARATVVMTTTLSSTPQDNNVILLDAGNSGGNGLVSSTTAYFGGANTVTFAGSAGIYHGSSSVAAAPTLNGSALTTNYFAGEPSGAVTFTYTSPQLYFGLLWGSVDTYNALSFYDGSTLVASFTGSQITTNPTGSQAADGSYFVSYNFTNSAQYTRVVMSSTSPAFEFNSIAYSTLNADVSGNGTGTPQVVSLTSSPTLPAPGGTALVPGLLLLALLRPWRRRRRMAAGAA